MWVPAANRRLWRALVGEKIPLPVAPEPEMDDQITFAEEEIDRTCPVGEERWFVSDARPVRDLGQCTGGVTLPRMLLQQSVKPTLITSVERVAASAALGCPPWELGLCAGLRSTDASPRAPCGHVRRGMPLRAKRPKAGELGGGSSEAGDGLPGEGLGDLPELSTA